MKDWMTFRMFLISYVVGVWLFMGLRPRWFHLELHDPAFSGSQVVGHCVHLSSVMAATDHDTVRGVAEPFYCAVIMKQPVLIHLKKDRKGWQIYQGVKGNIHFNQVLELSRIFFYIEYVT